MELETLQDQYWMNLSNFEKKLYNLQEKNSIAINRLHF